MRLIKTLVLLALVSGLSSGQIVFDDPKTKKVEAKPAASKPAVEAPKTGRQEKRSKGASMDKWVQTLSAGLGDANGAIRRSAAAALVNIGQPAIPALEALAAGEGRSAEDAKKVLDQIRRRVGRGVAAGKNRRGDSDRKTSQARVTEKLKQAGFDDAQMETVSKFRQRREELNREIFRQVQDGELTREGAAAARQRANKELNSELKEALGKEAYRKFTRATRAAGGRRSRSQGTDRRRRSDRKKNENGSGAGSGNGTDQ